MYPFRSKMKRTLTAIGAFCLMFLLVQNANASACGVTLSLLKRLAAKVGIGGEQAEQLQIKAAITENANNAKNLSHFKLTDTYTYQGMTDAEKKAYQN